MAGEQALPDAPLGALVPEGHADRAADTGQPGEAAADQGHEQPGSGNDPNHHAGIDAKADSRCCHLQQRCEPAAAEQAAHQG